ncbi:hypothetical protein ICW40_09265, partial [Actinotalea ferrariae]|nr:hypothetical protein [Actinotalea ferrariae]
IDAAVASLTADVADADRLAVPSPPTDPSVAAAAEAARQTLAAVPTERQQGDPLALVRRLTDAEAALDAALAPHRAREEAVARATVRLREVLQRVDVTLVSVNRFVQIHGMTVGTAPRAALAEAQAAVQEANALSETDPVAALAAADRAESRAATARRTAEYDVERATPAGDFAWDSGGEGSGTDWEERTRGYRWSSRGSSGWGGSGGGGGGGWLSGGSSGRSSSSSRSRQSSGGSFGRSSSSRRSSSSSSRRSSSSRKSSSRSSRSRGGGGRF